jgi:hypothetical protein
MDRISGYIVLPVPITGTVYVSVAVVEASFADAPSLPICHARFEIHHVIGAQLPFSLNVPSRNPEKDSRWIFDAAVTRLPGQLEPGDYVLARSIECVVSVNNEPVLLPLERVT